ncbi:hypothetical protein ACN2XU_18240 [Primorskyibacter sp. 2E107]|uniref:hypothetical protein n=1 Tax=Primorskyibacter sp. 2E107 TaxID=3403458 RepID=UPI003AF86F89
MAFHAILFVVLLLVPFVAQAQEARVVRLAAPEALEQSGLLQHILPRFSLKTQIRVRPVAPGAAADVAFGDAGRPVFEGAGQVWHVAVLSDGHPASERFVDWLTSEVGKNTVTGYAPEGGTLFSLPEQKTAAALDVAFEGDAVAGLTASERHCKRCHVVRPEERFGSIGSTPSFMILRAMPDWSQRFAAFYALNPHPSFTQIDGLSEPFAEDRPSPIAPVFMTLDEVEAILAYVQDLQPADLGAPIEAR